jgi:probable rRNA maturation factor
MIGINNLSGVKLNKQLLKKVIRKVLKGEKKEKIEISLVFVKPLKIRQLNTKYRKKNKATDVLSYIYNENSGELVICPQIVKKNDKKFKTNFKKELTRVLIHGILHLLGYNYKKMAKKEKYYLFKLKI